MRLLQRPCSIDSVYLNLTCLCVDMIKFYVTGNSCCAIYSIGPTAGGSVVVIISNIDGISRTLPRIYTLCYSSISVFLCSSVYMSNMSVCLCLCVYLLYVGLEFLVSYQVRRLNFQL